jgi:hypothetical protein
MKSFTFGAGAMALAALLLAATVGIALLAWKLLHVQTPPLPPKLASDWHNQTYGLDDDEMERFGPPPYSPRRMQDFGRGWGGSAPKGYTGQLSYHALPNRTVHWGMSSAQGDLLSAIAWCNGLTLADLDIPEELRRLPLDGDWVVRINAPIDPRMKALESICCAATRRDLIFEKKIAECDVIVARGNWNFIAVQGGREKRTPRRSIQFYTDKLDEQEGAGGGTGDLTQVFHRLEEIAQRKVIDEVSGRPKSDVEWYNNYSEHEADKSEAAMAKLLENLTKQTSLEFVRTKRMMPVWFIREKSPTTQPWNQ